MTQRHKKKRILITGSAGFTGGHLVESLSAGGSSELYLADRTKGVKDARFHLCDFSDTAQTAKLVRKIRPDAIYHLVGSYTNEYDADYASNVVTAKNILDGVRAAGMKTRILLIGSSAEYGFPENADTAVCEDHPCRPVSIYGLVKLMQTILFGTYVRLYEMDIIAVRPFNLFGKGMSPTLFVGKMEQEITRYKRGEIDKIVTGNLSVERDYIEIAEAIKYYRIVLEKGKTGEVYNIGSGKNTTLRDVLWRMLAAEGLPLDIVKESTHNVPGKIVVPKIFADISKIKKLG